MPPHSWVYNTRGLDPLTKNAHKYLCNAKSWHIKFYSMPSYSCIGRKLIFFILVSGGPIMATASTIGPHKGFNWTI